MTGDDKLTYNAAEVAALLGLGISKVYRALKADQIPNVRIGSTYRIPKAAFRTWLDGQLVADTAAKIEPRT